MSKTLKNHWFRVDRISLYSVV